MLPVIEQAAARSNGAVMGPQAPISAHSLLVPAVTGPWLKSEGCTAVP